MSQQYVSLTANRDIVVIKSIWQIILRMPMLYLWQRLQLTQSILHSSVVMYRNIEVPATLSKRQLTTYINTCIQRFKHNSEKNLIYISYLYFSNAKVTRVLICAVPKQYLQKGAEKKKASSIYIDEIRLDWMHLYTCLMSKYKKYKGAACFFLHIQEKLMIIVGVYAGKLLLFKTLTSQHIDDEFKQYKQQFLNQLKERTPILIAIPHAQQSSVEFRESHNPLCQEVTFQPKEMMNLTKLY